MTMGAAALALFTSTSEVKAAFGSTASGGGYIVDNGANLVVTINSAGNISSLKYNGTELNGSTASGINSGLGASTVTSTTTGNYIVIKCTATWIAASPLDHYYVFRNGYNNIYMADYVPAEPSNGELRWISRLKSSIFTGVPAESSLLASTGWIESTDVGGNADGTTVSKYYGNQMAKDLGIRGVTGSGVGVYMYYGNRESASGGPFFRDIQNQSGSDTELYNYMNSGHEQTEAYRVGVLHGPYVLMVTNGTTPSAPDTSVLSTLGLTGYVDSTGRGRVILNGLAGRDTAYTYTVGYANSTAQYWVTAAASNGACGCYNMKPGTYTMTAYKGQLAVYTESVTVTAGNPTTLNTRTISGDPSSTTAIWRVGDWDGTPTEFRNGANLNLMHPSDVRQSSWAPGTFVVGTSSLSSFPAYQWKDINGSQAIQFTLTAAQAAAAHTIRVGITAAYANARPDITVNSWNSANPSASSQPDSRSLTIGTYRGNNTTYTFSVPASAFVTGTNTLYLIPISGSGSTGYLSAGYSLDCVDFY
jgi:rhamnogalacturonan endolyase